MAQVLGEDVLTWQERVKTINNVTVADIREHYRRTHTLANMRFVLAGNIEGRESQITSMLESWELPEGERLSVPVDELHRADRWSSNAKKQRISRLASAWLYRGD